MKTAKEKAKELVEKYDETLTYLESKSKAKECAKIAVKEIIDALDDVNEIDYYVHVLKEIENYDHRTN
jgi:ribosomal protein S17E